MQRRRILSLTMTLGFLALAGCTGSSPQSRVVLYCAQDEPFARELLAEFTRQTGLSVDTKFDTEADKSVSLYNELVQDRAMPRCDVFWNNEILSTLRLQKLGLLEPYVSPSAASYPEWTRAQDNTWHAFAARARVLIVNTNLVPEAERPRSLLDLTRAEWRGRVTLARPIFGTSATQAACLFDVLGVEEAKNYYRALRANKVRIAPGNKQVAEWVGRGKTPNGEVVAVGITDTDDAYLELEAGHPVALVFPDAAADARLGTLLIPNTVCLIKNSPNPDGGRKLIDYLLSAAVERKLAEGESRQIPLNPQVSAVLPPSLEAGRKARAMPVHFDRAAGHWDEMETFLRNEFLRP